jgi:cell division protein FtsI (penicillin-binding protein 3)
MEAKKFGVPSTLPVIRAGNQDELTRLCNELGISNHSLTEEEWVRSSGSGGGSVKWKEEY